MKILVLKMLNIIQYLGLWRCMYFQNKDIKVLFQIADVYVYECEWCFQ